MRRPVGLLAEMFRVVGQIGQDGPAKLQKVQLPELLKEDIAVRSDENGERNRRGHRRVEIRLQIERVRRRELVVRAGRVVLLQKLDDLRLLLGIVGRQRNEVQAWSA